MSAMSSAALRVFCIHPWPSQPALPGNRKTLEPERTGPVSPEDGVVGERAERFGEDALELVELLRRHSPQAAVTGGPQTENFVEVVAIDNPSRVARRVWPGSRQSST